MNPNHVWLIGAAGTAALFAASFIPWPRLMTRIASLFRFSPATPSAPDIFGSYTTIKSYLVGRGCVDGLKSLSQVWPHLEPGHEEVKA